MRSNLINFFIGLGMTLTVGVLPFILATSLGGWQVGICAIIVTAWIVSGFMIQLPSDGSFPTETQWARMTYGPVGLLLFPSEKKERENADWEWYHAEMTETHTLVYRVMAKNKDHAQKLVEDKYMNGDKPYRKVFENWHFIIAEMLSEDKL